MNIWSGDFGTAYTLRNPITKENLNAREMLWRRILNAMLPAHPKSLLEVGANVGTNLKALKRILPEAEYSAVEPNDTARQELARFIERFASDIRDCDWQSELVFTSGVLIHIPPDELLDMCREIHRCSKRWIVAIEYYSHEPQEVEYRGAMGRLWKRDFGKFYLGNFPDLHPINCGFAWKPLTELDDLTWWAFEKR